MMENGILTFLAIIIFIIVVPFAWVILLGEKSEDPRVNQFSLNMGIDNDSNHIFIREFGVHNSELGLYNLLSSSPFMRSNYVIYKPSLILLDKDSH